MTNPDSAELADSDIRATRHRLGGPSRKHLPAAPDDSKRAAGIAALVAAHRGDVDGQLDLSRLLQREFERGPARYPQTVRLAATELLRAYPRLKQLAATAKRDRSGRLLKTSPFRPAPQLWTPKGPHNVEEIPPFTAVNLKRWAALADADAVRRPTPRPALAPAGSPRHPPQAREVPLEYMTVKVPGMSLATADGRIRILAAVIRLASGQRIVEGVARKLAATMNLFDYLVLDFEDTAQHAAKAYDGLPLGWTRLVKLHPEFLGDLQKLTKVQLTGKPRYWGPDNGFAREYLADFTADERSWYVIGRMANKPAKDARSGYRPGQIVNKDGIVFVGPELDTSLFFTPDGRLFGVPEKALRDQQLDAIVQGAKWARGAPILGYGMVAVGVVALSAPAILAVAAETAAGIIAAGSSAGAIAEGMVYSRYFVWLTMHWQATFAWGFAGAGLGYKIINFSPRAFLEEFRESPKDAVIGLGISLIETLHDFAEAYTSTPMRGGVAEPDASPSSPARPRPPSQPSMPADPDPTPITTSRPSSSPRQAPASSPPPSPSSPAASAAAPKRAGAPAAPGGAQVMDVSDAEDLAQKRQTGYDLQRSAKAANDDRAQAATAAAHAQAEQDEGEILWGRTGTDDREVPFGGGPSSVPASASRTPSKPSNRNTPSGGNVRPARGSPPAGGKPRAMPPNPPAQSGLKRIVLNDRAVRAAGLDARMKGFVERAAAIFKQELAAQSKNLPPWIRSTAAHKNALDRLRAEYHDVTEQGQPLTGVTGPATATGQPNVRISDATYVDLKSPARAHTPADLTIEFKFKAYPGKGGKVLIASGSTDPSVTSGQIQAYEVGQTQLGVPAFVVSGAGNIYTFSGGRWTKVGGPE